MEYCLQKNVHYISFSCFQKLAEILSKSARDGSYVDPYKVEQILGVLDTETETSLVGYVLLVLLPAVFVRVLVDVSIWFKSQKKVNCLPDELNKMKSV